MREIRVPKPKGMTHATLRYLLAQADGKRPTGRKAVK